LFGILGAHAGKPCLVVSGLAWNLVDKPFGEPFRMAVTSVVEYVLAALKAIGVAPSYIHGEGCDTVPGSESNLYLKNEDAVLELID